jgi:hypothetical protein
MQRHAFSLLCLVALAAPLAADASTIKKCQDATGKWHYGDTAAAECAKSKVVEMSQEGVARKVIAAPPTEAELRQRELNRSEEERKKKESEDRARNDQLLLSTYGHEQDILFVRDRKLGQLESMIKAGEETLKSLRGALARLEAQAADDSKDPKSAEQTRKQIEQTQAQIARHEESIAGKRKEQDAIRAQAEVDQKRYRELKQAPAPRAAAEEGKK